MAQSTTTKSASAQNTRQSQRRRRRGDPGRYMISKLLVLSALFIVLFEGNMIKNLVTHRVGSSLTTYQGAAGSGTSDKTSSSNVSTLGALSSTGASGESATPDQGLAGLAGTLLGIGSGSGASSDDDTNTQAAAPAVESEAPSTGETIDSDAVVPEQAESVDDSFFSDAVFIGDSRMEGFRNASGITQGTFLTGVGLSINDMDKQIISTSDGQISVYQGLSGRQYKRIYLMLGTNDLGFYPWEDFQPLFEKVIKQFHELQPGATIYVCSVIYVEESKIAQGFEYDNNENVQTINKYILGTCEDLWYSYYVNLNEIFSDGNHELIPGASADGIHLEAEYCEDMLTYLKSHYLTDDEWAEVVTANGGSLEPVSEAGTEAEEASNSAEASGDDADSGISAG